MEKETVKLLVTENTLNLLLENLSADRPRTASKIRQLLINEINELNYKEETPVHETTNDSK